MYTRRYWSLSTSKVLHELDSSEKGLTKKQAGERLAVYGANEIGKREIRTGLFIFLSQFRNPLVVILIGASTVAAFLGELTDATIIIVIVAINGFFDFTSLPLHLLGIVSIVVVGYMVATEMVKLAYSGNQ